MGVPGGVLVLWCVLGVGPEVGPQGGEALGEATADRQAQAGPLAASLLLLPVARQREREISGRGGEKAWGLASEGGWGRVGEGRRVVSPTHLSSAVAVYSPSSLGSP